MQFGILIACDVLLICVVQARPHLYFVPYFNPLKTKREREMGKIDED
jgi:hypothetical protein